MAIGDAFAAHGNIKISVFKSATQDKREIEKMGKFGRKHVIANYSWKQFLDKFEQYAKQVSKM